MLQATAAKSGVVADSEAPRVVLGSSVPWAEMSPGVELKMLRIGEGTGTYSLMSRFAPGTVLPRHRHLGAVWGYTLEGRWKYREYDWTAEAGSFIHEPPGSTHTLEVPEDNPGTTTVVFTIEKGMELLSDDGEVLSVEDATTVNRYYEIALEMAGVEAPAGILP